MNKPNAKSKTKDIHIKPSLYEDEQFILNFKKLCAQDGLSYMEAFKEMGGPWFVKHNLDLGGNPQRQLFSFGEQASLVVEKCRCGFANCKGDAVGVAIYLDSGKTYKLCSVHYGFARGASKIWRPI